MTKNKNNKKNIIQFLQEGVEKICTRFNCKKTTVYFVFGALFLLILLMGWNLVFRSSSRDISQYQTVQLERSDLVAIVGATGSVQANQSVSLYWQTSGRVAKVLVKVGDAVQPGQALATLEQNSLSQSIILAQADLVVAQRNLEDLVESNTTTSQAYYQLLKAEEKLRKAKDNRDRWNYNNAAQDRVEEARQAFIETDEILKKLDGSDEAFEQATLERDKALRNLNFLLGKTYDQKVAEDYAQYDIALAELEDAQREWDRVKDGTNTDDIRAAEARVAAAEATIALASLTAPFSGTVTEVAIKTGDEISASSPAFRIDDLSLLIVEVDIPEVDINRVQIGQSAELTFDAILGKKYQGEVIEVALVGSSVQGQTNFIVQIELLDPDEEIKPGLTSAVNIIVNKLEDVLAVPNRAVRISNGNRVVYVLRNGKLETVELTLGASSDTVTEVISGNLQEGDLIVLNPPFNFDTGGGRPGFVR